MGWMRLAVVLIGSVLAALTAGAQTTTRQYRVGVLTSGFTPAGPTLKGLKAGLEAAGLVEGRDITLDIQLTSGGECRPTSSPSPS